MENKEKQLISSKLKYDFNDIFEMTLYILSFTCFIYYLFQKNTMKTLQPIYIIFVITTIKIIMNYTKMEISSVLRFFILFFVFMAMFLAVEFDFYTLVPKFDKLEHLLSGGMFVFIGFALFKYINRNDGGIKINNISIILFCLFFSIAIAGCWEIYEFSVDRLFGLNCQRGSLVDTMHDIMCGTTGATVSSIYLFNRLKKHPEDLVIHSSDNSN